MGPRTQGTRSSIVCRRRVSIQLIAPASGASAFIESLVYRDTRVSIQLIAPASGALNGSALMSLMPRSSFHSTDCPSEWGLITIVGTNPKHCVSIQLIAPASGALVRTQDGIHMVDSGFHSTDCPSEWGLRLANDRKDETDTRGFHSTDCPSEWGQPTFFMTGSGLGT